MAWEGVPWAIADGALHSAEVARLLAYAATQGGEGVVGPGDCKVVASDTPDGNVHINSGALGVLNRFAGGGQQSYLLRNIGDEVKALTPQGAGGERYDLVCVIVEDPQYPGQPDPASVPDGPYLRTVVYEDVPADTVSLAEVDADQTGYALALVHFDASDGTVTTGDITDLRELLAPRVETVKKVLNENATAAIPGSIDLAPAGASWSIRIPTWAKRVQLEARWYGVKFTDTASGAGAFNGQCRVDLGALTSQTTNFQVDATASNKPVTQTLGVGDDLDVPEGVRGTLRNLQAKLAKTGGSGMTGQTTPNTTVVVEATFYETVE